MAALTLLVVNDWVLKPAFSNWMTGKLSDVAGLVAFAMCGTALLPDRRRAIFLVTGVAFVVWKSPASEPMLEAWNAHLPWQLGRAADWSDLLALLALAATCGLVGRIASADAPDPGWRRRIAAVAAGVVAVLTFTATSLRYPTPIDWGETIVSGSRDQVVTGLDSVHVPISVRRQHPGPLGADTLVVGIRHGPEGWITVKVQVREVGGEESTLRPLSLNPGYPGATDAIRTAFVEQVVQPLQGWLERRATTGSRP